MVRIFSGSTFIEKEELKDTNICHPIKLEYYKIINEDEKVKNRKAKFGINVVKTEYKQEHIKIENKIIQHLSNDESKIEEVLEMFKKHKVTPITVEDILSDFSKKIIFI